MATTTMAMMMTATMKSHYLCRRRYRHRRFRLPVRVLAPEPRNA
jgi:hypothetical protein